MPALKFPVTLTHPVTGGVTVANTPSGLRVLKKRGWQAVGEKRPRASKPKPAVTRELAPQEPSTSTTED